MTQVAGERYVYKFVCEPEALYSMSGSISSERCHSSPFALMNQYRHHSYLSHPPGSPYDLSPYAANRMYYGGQPPPPHFPCGGSGGCQSGGGGPHSGGSPGYFQQMSPAAGNPHAMRPEVASTPFSGKSQSGGDPNYIMPPLSRTPYMRERL